MIDPERSESQSIANIANAINAIGRKGSESQNIANAILHAVRWASKYSKGGKMGISLKDHGRLDRVRRIYCDLKINAERLQDVRDSITRIKSMRYGDRVQHSGGDYIADSFAVLESIEEAIIKQTAALEAEKQEIIADIRKLKRPEYIEVLYLRYVRLMDYESISGKMGYDARHLCKMSKKAAAAFEALEAAADRAAV